MKVCHITTAHNALDTRIFYREARSLVKNGFKVHIVGINAREEILDNVHIIPLMSSNNRLLRMALKPLKAFYLSVRTGSQIYHFHDPELIPVGIMLKLMGKKVIYDAHEDYPQLIMVKDWVPKYIKAALSRLTYVLERFASRFFDMTCAPSDPLSKRLPNGVALYNFPTSEILSLLKVHSRPYKERNIDVIHVGVLRKVRIDFLITVLKLLVKEHIRFKWAFIGLTQQQIDYIKAQIGDQDTVLLIGKVPFSEVAELLGRSKIGINYHPIEPHLKYAVPVKVIEYMAAGCVTLTSEFPFLKTFFGSDSPVIFSDHDSQKFADTITCLLKDPLRLEEAGISSQKYSRNFSWKTEENKLIKSYEGLI